MAFSKSARDQLKNKTVDEFITALLKDGWARDLESKRGAVLVFRKRTSPPRRVTIHYHPKKVYGWCKLLEGLLNDIGWSEEDMKRLKLIK
jgi:predicted RNA binding protein YcfA (HicA-like mRNA interferase family)